MSSPKALARRARPRVILMSCCALMVALPGLARAFSWDDVGRVAAFVVTYGWSEVILELIRSIDATKDNIRGQLDAETKAAVQGVRDEVQRNRKIADSTQERVGYALERGRRAYAWYTATHIPVAERDQPILRRATQPNAPQTTPSSATTTLSRAQTGVEGRAQPAAPAYTTPYTASRDVGLTKRDQRSASAAPVPADVALLREAQDRLETAGREFQQASAATRASLDSVTVSAEAHVVSINAEVVTQFIGPLNDLRALVSVEEVLFGPEGGRILEILNRRMGGISTTWDRKAVTIRSSITNAADAQIRAADAARLPPLAEWIERVASLIEAATGAQAATIGAAQAKDQLRKELGTTSLAVLARSAAPMPASAQLSATGAASTVAGTFDPGRLHAANMQRAADVQRWCTSLTQRYSQLDPRLLQQARSTLLAEFQGRSPQQIAARRAELLREAQMRFGSNPSLLNATARIVDYHARAALPR